MYTWTAEVLSASNATLLRSFHTSTHITFNPGGKPRNIGIFHGSPADDKEFLFPDTPVEHLIELCRHTSAEIIITGHSHTPFHRCTGKTHFINPGSVGRMFDGDPRASCAVLTLTPENVSVEHFRISYPILQVINGIKQANLPAIYARMFMEGKKLN